MKRKFLAVLTALTVLTMGSMTAFAASPTVGTTEAPVRTQEASTAMTATTTPSAYLSGTTVSAGHQDIRSIRYDGSGGGSSGSK